MASTDEVTTTNAPAAVTSGGAAPPTASTNGATSTAIDSALLSAMRDSRERLALLKCERVMVDFCNAPDVQEIDVGGSYNSIIIGLSGNNNNNMRSSSEGRRNSQ
jgi:hypothetical protein